MSIWLLGMRLDGLRPPASWADEVSDGDVGDAPGRPRRRRRRRKGKG